jgi:hypothetical protein
VLACSQVTDAEKLLHETLASVGQNIMRRFKLVCEKRGESLHVRLWPPAGSLISSYPCFYNTYPGVVQTCSRCW